MQTGADVIHHGIRKLERVPVKSTNFRTKTNKFDLFIDDILKVRQKTWILTNGKLANFEVKVVTWTQIN